MLFVAKAHVNWYIIFGRKFVILYVLHNKAFRDFYHRWCHVKEPEKVKVQVTLRPKVSRSVRLGVRHPSGTSDQFLFLLEIFFRQLRVCYFVAPSLTRGRVCNLLFLLVLASAVPRDSRPYFIVPVLQTSPTWRTRSPYLYPPGTEWPRYIPGHWVPFPSPLTTHRDYGGGILSRLHTGL
jgi:hypothetical protein